MGIFISYTAADESWARWIGEVLESAGVPVSVQMWDSRAGQNFVSWIDGRLRSTERTIAVCSAAYFSSAWCTREWTAALVAHGVIPLRIADCALPPVLATAGYRDLHGVGEDEARRRVLEALGLSTVDRTSGGYPGSHPQGQTESLPDGFAGVSKMPARNPHFTGREVVLAQLRERLNAGGPVAVTALHGLGGIGKTQLAVEYAHRHVGDYGIVWWIDAEETTLIAEQLAALGARIDLAVTGQIRTDAALVLNELRRRDRWLLVFDNAETPATMRPWLPGGAGHVLVTSRSRNWGGVAEAIDIDVLPRAEAVALLVSRIPGLELAVATALAEEVGDLPLALAQTASYLEMTGLRPGEYLERFRTRRASMLAKGQDLIYGGTVDTAWALSLDALSRRAPAAVQLLELCAHFGPDPIPLALIRDHAEHLEPPFRGVVDGEADADLDDTIGEVLAYSLARRTGDTLQLHRLVATVIRQQQDEEAAQRTAATVRSVLVAHQPPEQIWDPVGWPTWALLTPHVLTAPALHPDDPRADIGHEARQLLLGAGWTLDARGDAISARALHLDLHARWTATLGPDDPDTLRAATNLARDLRAAAETDRARRLDEDTLTRLRRVLGDDHPETCYVAQGLAISLRRLGQFERARQLNEETLKRRRRVLGDDHPNTLGSAVGLGRDLLGLGDAAGARTLDEDTLARRRRVLGVDHPESLVSAANLALDLRILGEVAAARTLDEDTLGRRQLTLGDNHPATLYSACNVASDLYVLGDVEAARALDEDTLARRRRVLVPEHPEILLSVIHLVLDLKALGQVTVAAPLETEARERFARGWFRVDLADRVRRGRLIPTGRAHESDWWARRE
jgi:hypothetical protein